MAVSGGLVFTALDAGGDHTCAVTTGGAGYCWGHNLSGQLGDGSTTDRTTPVAVSGELTFVSLDAGGGHTCGAIASGAAYCWGGNRSSQLGNGGTTEDRTTPVAVLDVAVFESVRAGSTGTCGVSTGGVAYCWGVTSVGERNIPTKVLGQP